jgi:hypothetical protein
MPMHVSRLRPLPAGYMRIDGNSPEKTGVESKAEFRHSINSKRILHIEKVQFDLPPS